MKLPERFPPDDPREWMNRARSNLARLKSRVPGVYLEDLCFDAQQAAEKAIKAMLIACNIEFPYVPLATCYHCSKKGERPYQRRSVKPTR